MLSWRACSETIMTDSYQVLVGWSEDDAAYVARVLDLPGCLAHGETQDEALDQAREAIALYLEDLRDSDEAVPAPVDYLLLPA